MTDTAVRPAALSPFRLFSTTVARVTPLCPSFVRITLTGDDLDEFADNGFDQRVKLLVPGDGRGLPELPGDGGWYAAWRALPDDVRCAMRTYTVREVRAADREIDLDIVLHGVAGPASRWASQARVGAPLGVVGPHARHPGPHGGVDFAPPAHSDAYLLAGDETAVPAIAGILRGMPDDAVGEALLEVPLGADRFELEAPDGVRVAWLPRDGARHGERLLPALADSARRLLEAGAGRDAAAAGGAPLEDVDVDSQLLWEVPVDGSGAPLLPRTQLYAWLAGEAGVIKEARRHLVGECGMDRSSVAFMGYWRHGRSEAN